MASPTKTPNLTEPTKILLSTKYSRTAITFLDLPLEILYMIVGLLHEEKLPTLRLISKQARHRLSDIFAKVKFAHLRHHLTEPSLQDLVHITSDANFSKHVRSIEFSTVRTKSPSSWYSLPRNSNPLPCEDSEFRRSGRHIAMVTTALENLRRYNNHEVSLGVFESLCKDEDSLSHALKNSPTCTILGHGYERSYGVEDVPTGVNPYGTMFAIREAANNSGYPLQRLSINAVVNSPTQTKLIKDDQADVLLIEGSNHFKPNLKLKHEVIGSAPSYWFPGGLFHCLTVEIQTGSASDLSLKGHLWPKGPVYAGDYQKSHRAMDTGSVLLALPPAFTDTKHRRFALLDLHFQRESLTWLCSRTMQQTFECLEFSNVEIIDKDFVNSPEFLAVTFWSHFKKGFNIKKLKISNFVVSTNVLVPCGENTITFAQPLRLAAHEIFAEGHDQVQSLFDDLIAQTFTWYEGISSVGRNWSVVFPP